MLVLDFSMALHSHTSTRGHPEVDSEALGDERATPAVRGANASERRRASRVLVRLHCDVDVVYPRTDQVVLAHIGLA